MTEIPSLMMNSEDFKLFFPEVGGHDDLLPEDDTIPEAYDTVPSNDYFSGTYNFDVGIPPSKSLMYSPRLEKLFIKMSLDFTVHFTWHFQHPMQFYVRAKPRFTNHEDASKSVKRCLQHSHKEDHSNRDVNGIGRHHVMRCNNTQAVYEGGRDQHFSVIIPLPLPEAGAEFVSQTYQFVCQNSCSSGMNRRPIEVIFTLEDKCGSIHGRKSVNVRVCSCPKRDKEKEELELGNSPAGQPPPGKRRKATKRSNPQPVVEGEIDTTVHPVTINVIGLHNKRALLKYAFDIHSGDMVLQPGTENLYKPLLDDLRNNLNNS